MHIDREQDGEKPVWTSLLTQPTIMLVFWPCWHPVWIRWRGWAVWICAMVTSGGDMWKFVLNFSLLQLNQTVWQYPTPSRWTTALLGSLSLETWMHAIILVSDYTNYKVSFINFMCLQILQWMKCLLHFTVGQVDFSKLYQYM